MKKLPHKVRRIRVHAGVTVRMVPQLGIDVEKDRVTMELAGSGVWVDQGQPFGIKLIPYSNIYEVDFANEENE